MSTDNTVVQPETNGAELPEEGTNNKPEKASRMKGYFVYRWFCQKDKLADTKTIFDSLRNMGICVAMLLGLQSLYKATDYLSNIFQSGLGIIVIVASAFVAVANIVWTMESLKEESPSWANAIVIIIGVLVILAFAYKAAISLPGI